MKMLSADGVRDIVALMAGTESSAMDKGSFEGEFWPGFDNDRGHRIWRRSLSLVEVSFDCKL